MVAVIAHEVRIDTPFFRWFDSGDLQSLEQLQQICWIAEQLPQISFWLPTQEHKWAKQVTPPKNLVIRLSARTIDSKWQSKTHLSSSTSRTKPTCPADGNCGSCRACWSSEVKHVIYRAH